MSLKIINNCITYLDKELNQIEYKPKNYQVFINNLQKKKQRNVLQENNNLCMKKLKD